MIKSIKTLAALLIIGTSFTACTKEETAPEPQVSIQDFEGSYRYITHPGLTTTLVATTRTTFEGFEVVELKRQTLISFVDLTRRDANSFTGNFVNTQRQIRGSVLLFVDPAGVRKFTTEISSTGEILQAIED